MLVNDGVVEKMFIEPEEPGDPFKVSDADTMLKFIAPEWKAQESVAIFTKPGCHSVLKLKKALQDKGLSYEENRIGQRCNCYFRTRYYRQDDCSSSIHRRQIHRRQRRLGAYLAKN